MQLFMTVHRPLSFKGTRMRNYPIEAQPSELVSAFKARMQPIIDVAPDLMTVIYKGVKKNGDEPLSLTEFVPCTADRCFIHIRVEDPEMLARVKELQAKGYESFIIPLDQIVVGD